MPRVVGCDPGTSSLDCLVLDDGHVAAQARFTPTQLRESTQEFTDFLQAHAPLDLVAAPSGYGLPLVAGSQIDENALDLMSLVRPDERGADQGVVGFRSWVRAALASGHPCVFLPGVIHLPSVAAHRKINAIDLGTADKLSVAALALFHHVRNESVDPQRSTFAVVEIGSAFTSILVVEQGAIVDACAGTRGPLGLQSSGAWDGEVAYWLSPLSKSDLFRGGLDDLGPLGPAAFRESLRKAVAALRSVVRFDTIYVSGRGAERPDVAPFVAEALEGLGHAQPLGSLACAWVKHAAQGAALLADGLCQGTHAWLVDSLRIRESHGTALDHLGIRRHGPQTHHGAPPP